jgi:hypothetical protein
LHGKLWTIDSNVLVCILIRNISVLAMFTFSPEPSPKNRRIFL